MPACPNTSIDAAGLPYGVTLLAPGVDRPGFDAGLLGIEVTDPALAAACGLGNIDPQHGEAASTRSPAAIEACLDAPLPPRGSRLATIRPDLDALGAMALLSLRASGRPVDRAVEDRVARIAALDRFDRGPWPGPRPLPRTAAEIADDWPGKDLAQLAACVRDPARPLAARVTVVLRWLETGILPEDNRDSARGLHEALVRSLRLGTTRVELALRGRVAVVVSLHPAALSLGYRLAPIVVALNPVFAFPSGHAGRKFTIARWGEGDGDLDRVVARLSALEPGWGGQRGIKGSPQSHPSELSLARVLCVTRSALRSGGN
jgi:hypothetical protein